MILIRRPARSAPICVGLLLWSLAAAAQDRTLTKGSEVGFQRLIHSAQAGAMGDDVINANVGVLDNRVSIELVRASGANKLLFLTRKRSTQTVSRYFDIELGAGATPSDAVRVGEILDEAFQDDPFQRASDFLGVSSHQPIPSFAEAWRYDGSRGVLRVLDAWLIAPAGVTYTIAVIIVVAIALLAGVILLWGSMPQRTLARRESAAEVPANSATD